MGKSEIFRSSKDLVPLTTASRLSFVESKYWESKADPDNVAKSFVSF